MLFFSFRSSHGPPHPIRARVYALTAYRCFRACCQECTFFSTGYAEVEYYCSDSCDDPTQCGDEEVCELIYDRCVDYTRPCPPTATCVTVTTAPTPMPPCSDCGEYQAS